jgi:hypothetical protein
MDIVDFGSMVSEIRKSVPWEMPSSTRLVPSPSHYMQYEEEREWSRDMLIYDLGHVDSISCHWHLDDER